MTVHRHTTHLRRRPSAKRTVCGMPIGARTATVPIGEQDRRGICWYCIVVERRMANHPASGYRADQSMRDG